MNLRRLFAINVVLAVLFGVTCTLLPRQLCELYGLPLDTAGVWTTRLLGGSLLGFATLMWFGCRSPSIETRRAIALALMIQDCVGLLASLAIQLTGKMAVVGWSNVILYGLLSTGYAYYAVLRPARA
jgi:hypothetical protein